MTPALALAELRAAGVAVRLGPDGAVTLHASRQPPPAVLALARTHRDGITALLRGDADMPVPDPAPVMLPGVPPDWCEGVALLAALPAPSTILPARWAALAATAHRLLHAHGAALHGAGWGTLDVWGLHARAPEANPAGWGLAWLLDAHGVVLDVGPDVVGIRRAPDGARLAFRRRARCGPVVPAWALALGSGLA